ncbi:MAG TPA: flagellar biosynthesis anti-sigma factor FlgM [Candidatus Sulfotelmatobacter sp.]|nr:flagellar biosynthesis anti-sigma factor FlgM [Candidatus Sulfotelmatobacter sp.]
MRIDFNPGTQAAPETTSSRPQSASDERASSSAFGEDQAQLSGAHVQVQALAAQVSQMPEVREERVQALRQAVASGTYRPSPHQVASSMISHMVSR